MKIKIVLGDFSVNFFLWSSELNLYIFFLNPPIFLDRISMKAIFKFEESESPQISLHYKSVKGCGQKSKKGRWK